MVITDHLLAAAAQQAAEAEAEAEAGLEAGTDEESTGLPPPQPPIVEPDRAVLLKMLTAAIGSEQPNGIHTRELKADATEAQRRAYEASVARHQR